MGYIIWLLEFICITFGCADYLEALVALPFICGSTMGIIILIVAFKRLVVWGLMQVKLIRRLDCMALLVILKWRSVALRYIEKRLDKWYDKMCYPIIQEKRHVLIEHRRAMRLLERLDSQR